MTKYTNEQLEEMISSDDVFVRNEVAKQGYSLAILVNDESWVVRREVARQGYRLDLLINDQDTDVRAEVAKQGYGLDKLIDDSSWCVRNITNKLIKFKNHKVIAHNFGTYDGNLYLYYNNENDYIIISGCYETNNINDWKFKCESQLDVETSEKYSEIIINELKY